MSEGSRFWKAMGNLGLALINATLILVIVAALSIGFAAHAVRDFTENTARQAAEAAFDVAGLEPGQIRETLNTVSDDLTNLRRTIADTNLRDSDRTAILELREEVERLRTVLDDLTVPTLQISEATLNGLAERAGEIFVFLQTCRNDQRITGS